MACQPYFFKGFLLTCTCFLLLVGLTFITVGLLIKETENDIQYIKVMNVFMKAYSGLIGVGLSICLIALIGCFGSLFQVYWMILLHIIFICIIVVAEITIIIVYVVHLQKLSDSFLSFSSAKCKGKNCVEKNPSSNFTFASVFMDYMMPIKCIITLVIFIQVCQLVTALKLAIFIHMPKTLIDLNNVSGTRSQPLAPSIQPDPNAVLGVNSIDTPLNDVASAPVITTDLRKDIVELKSIKSVKSLQQGTAPDIVINQNESHNLNNVQGQNNNKITVNNTIDTNDIVR